MIRVILNDGSCRDVAEAVDGERRGHEIILAGHRGQVVARFDCTQLMAYGPPETLPGPMAISKRMPTACHHAWTRLKSLEELLDVVVYVRQCSVCGRVDAKAGHKDPAADDSWAEVAPPEVQA